MPEVETVTYPDKVNDILKDHKLMRAFNQYVGSLRRIDHQGMFQFVQTTPNPTGMWDFLHPLQRRGKALRLKLKKEDYGKIVDLEKKVNESADPAVQKEHALKNWKGWGDIRRNALALWTAEIDKNVVPRFYNSKQFQKLHSITNASGDSLPGMKNAVKAIKAVSVDKKTMKKLGYSLVNDDKLRLSLSAVAKAAALGQDDMGKRAFAEVIKIEKLPKISKYDDLVKLLKRAKVIF